MDQVISSFPVVDNKIIVVNDLSSNKDNIYENYIYPELETIDRLGGLLTANLYANVTSPFNFSNSNEIRDLSRYYNQTDSKGQVLNKVLAISTGSAILGGILLSLKGFLKKIPTIGFRLGKHRQITSFRTRQLQKSTVDISRVLNEYHNQLYTTLVGSYLYLGAHNENISLNGKVEYLQKQLSISLTENMLLRQSNDKVASLNDEVNLVRKELNIRQDIIQKLKRQLLDSEKEISAKEQLISVLKYQKTELQNMLIKKARDQQRTTQIESNIFLDRLRTIEILENQLSETRYKLEFMENKLIEYQETMFKIHEFYRQRDSIEIEKLSGERNINNVYEFNIPSSQNNNSQYSDKPNWFRDIISGTLGATLSAIGLLPITSNMKLTLEDKLKFQSTLLDNKEIENVMMRTYTDAIMKRSNFDHMRHNFRESFLMKQLDQHINENSELKSTIVSLKKEFKEKESDYISELSKLDKTLSDLQATEVEKSLSLDKRMSLLMNSMNDIQTFGIIRGDFDGFKSFISQYGFRHLRTYNETYESFRSVYGYEVTPSTSKTASKIIGYLDVISILTKNGSTDNLYRALESKNFDEFLQVVDISNSILARIILRPPRINPVAQINDQADKTESFLTYVNMFFNENATNVAIAAGLVSAFMIGTDYRSLLGLLGSLATYIGRTLIQEIKNESIIMFKHLIIDAIIWALKMVYKKGRSATSKLFKYIERIGSNRSGQLIENIPLTDPVIEHATIYIDNYIKGGKPYEDPAIELEFENSVMIARDDIVKEDSLDNAVNRILDYFAKSAKNRVEYRGRGVVRSLLYNLA